MPEITLNEPFGQAIVATIHACRVRSVIEVGSWDGTGSTSVLMHALSAVPDPRLVCVEPDPHRFSALQSAIEGRPWVTSICSRSVSRESMTAKCFDDVWQSPYNGLRFPEHVVREWWNNQHSGPGCLEAMADQSWDAALIDGCEFAGYDDFLFLRDRVRVLMLDDAFHAFKCSRAHEELRDAREWACIWSSVFCRNGASIWARL